MHSPLPTITIIFLYLMMVHFGPKIMKNFPAFEMKPLLFVFNTGVVVFYAYLSKEVTKTLVHENKATQTGSYAALIQQHFCSSSFKSRQYWLCMGGISLVPRPFLQHGVGSGTETRVGWNHWNQSFETTEDLYTGHVII